MNCIKNSGALLYKEAKKIIPGGTQLLSKRPEMFLPELWPSYYKEAKGCKVIDLDNNVLTDMTTCGIGSCLLGFADPDVNEAVKKRIDDGSMCTLNTPDEVELAKLLCEIHPWADMVRYARTGGEIMSIAVRIARAHTGRDKVAICGYHGWSDWYLAANLSTDKALEGHLLPGLSPNGVPKGLSGSVLSFHYNALKELEGIIKNNPNELAAIVMEPIRGEMPTESFLQQVKERAEAAGAVLIFDEITSGWRFNVGGVHLKLGVEPDMAVFAKSISNGFPMAAVIGRENVMEAAQESFISSTYWTEGIGPTAAIATITKMRELNISAHVNKIGTLFQKGVKDLSLKHNLPLEVNSLPALTKLSFKHKNSQEMMTLFTQLMLKRGFLAGGSFYPAWAHSEKIIDNFLGACDECFAEIKPALDNDGFTDVLQGPVAHKGFARLN